ncbi:hypothetical protein CLM85_20085 [Streptomyces albidoflavus]|nr:hypothetical protein CLM81_03875 [Streptomyces albidoflavus]PAX89955.1 hypothetical protein CLM82_18165 [Streptomyces albidoflavus]PBO19323.1 hypothetical protein CLM83_07120 [Streptomyces albidoflavus]PBO22761.1 hypothetical protein CLM85_20085 [Streptomyces albidoflavus]PBO29164.1 hypothetical protein CLM84_15710 [Streptomyces albidoflavus]
MILTQETMRARHGPPGWARRWFPRMGEWRAGGPSGVPAFGHQDAEKACPDANFPVWPEC